MEGHQRAIMGNMTVEQIYRDRQTFSTKVFEVNMYDYFFFGIKENFCFQLFKDVLENLVWN